MATSSIFTNVNIKDPEKARKFANLLIDAYEHQEEVEYTSDAYVSDPEKIKEWWDNAQKRKTSSI